PEGPGVVGSDTSCGAEPASGGFGPGRAEGRTRRGAGGILVGAVADRGAGVGHPAGRGRAGAGHAAADGPAGPIRRRWIAAPLYPRTMRRGLAAVAVISMVAAACGSSSPRAPGASQ